MTDMKLQYLKDKVFGGKIDEAKLANLLKQGPQAINQELEESGIVPKQRKEADPPAEGSAEVPSYNALILTLIEGMATQDERLAKLEQGAMAEATIKEQARQADADKLKTLEGRMTEAEKQLSLTPRRASEATQTALTDDEAEKVKENLPNDADEFWGPAVKKA